MFAFCQMHSEFVVVVVCFKNPICMYGYYWDTKMNPRTRPQDTPPGHLQS